MKPFALILAVIVIGAASGVAGSIGYAELETHGFSLTPGSVLIDNFSLSSNVIEQSLLSGATFNIQATSTGQAGYQVYLTNGTLNLTISSGSFYKTLNYTDLSLGSLFLLGSLTPGGYGIVASVFEGDNIAYRTTHLSVVSPVNISSISGPTNVSDAGGVMSVSYTANVTGGVQPFYYNWSIISYYSGNIQNYSETDSVHSAVFTLLFYQNPSNGSSYGPTATYYINLKVTDSLGFTYTTAYPGFEVNVTAT